MNVSPATKAAAISDYLAGKGGYFQIALEYGINPYTLKKWVESPEKALNQSSQITKSRRIIVGKSFNHRTA